MTPETVGEQRVYAPVADPAPLGMGAFALTMFLVSVHYAGWAPSLVWLGPALVYGGLAQFLAGMWEFRNRNAFGATMFTTYAGLFWSLAAFTLLGASRFGAGFGLRGALAWLVLGFAIFAGYMLLWSTGVNVAMFLFHLAFETSLIVLVIGLFMPSMTLIHIGSWIGIVTAAIAWYAGAAGVVNRLSLGHHVLPLGGRMWSRRTQSAPTGSPLPRPMEPRPMEPRAA